MNYTSSRSVRRIIGRLSKGEAFIGSLERLCKRERVRAGTVRAVGLLRRVELQTYQSNTGYRTTLDAEATFEVLSLEGNISTLGDQVILNCYTHVGAHHFNQWQTFGGRLGEAEALSIEFVIEVFEDVVLERRLDERTKLPVWNKLERLDQDVFDASDAPPPISRPARPVETPTASAESDSLDESTSDDTPPEPKSTGERASAFTSSGTVISASTPQVVRRPTRPTRVPKEEEAAETPVVKTPTKPTKPTPKPVKSAPTPTPNRRVVQAKKASASSWADAVQASKAVKTAAALGTQKGDPTRNRSVVDDWPDMPELQIGDMLNHPHFGLCRIIFVEEDDYVKIRTRRGKVVDIKLEVCEITLAHEQDEHNVFNCKIVPS